MSDVDYFNFENKDLDFPIYKKNPYIPKSGWIVLFIAMVIGFCAQVISNEILGGFLFVIIILIPLLYYLKWDIKAIFQKPRAKDIGLAILLFAGYMVYSIVMGEVLTIFSLNGSDIVTENTVSWISVVSLVFSLMGEELIKFIPFMFFMRIIYKYSENRKLAVVLSMGIVMVFFALLHAMDLKSIVSVLLLQGLGSIFEFFGYIKTKNLLVSYTTHLLTDVFIFVIILMGMA